MSYSFLKPVRIGNMVLKNRVIVPAMARYLSLIHISEPTRPY